MVHEEVQEIVERFSAQGGIVHHIPEGAVTVDWSKTKFFYAASAYGKAGHKKRWHRNAAP